MESHLLQMRGLKQELAVPHTGKSKVASFTDAWIETPNLLQGVSIEICRIFYRCVD